VSDPIDIKALDEYLKGGSDISQRYRELGADDVPPELDRRVLEQARAAVAGGGAARSRSWLRWSAPVALAASVVLVVAVVIESPVQDETLAIQPPSEVSHENSYADQPKLQDETAQAPQPEPESAPPAFVPEQPAPSAAPAAAPPPSAASVSKTERKRADSAPVVEEVLTTAPAAREQSIATSQVAVDTVTVDAADAQIAAERPAPSLRTETISARNEADRAAGVAADSSAKASEETQIQEAIVTGSRQRRSQGRTAGPRNTISGSAFESRPTADADAEQTDPAKWLEQIRDLRRDGKIAAADRAWEEFRAAFPQFPVAEDDLARKQP
jgi:hypothetical protein